MAWEKFWGENVLDGDLHCTRCGQASNDEDRKPKDFKFEGRGVHKRLMCGDCRGWKSKGFKPFAHFDEKNAADLERWMNEAFGEG